MTGFAMTQSMVQYLPSIRARRSARSTSYPASSSPRTWRRSSDPGGDGNKGIVFPDTSGVVNSPLDGKFHMYPKGGATVDRSRAPETARLPCPGRTASLAAAKLLDTKCKVPFEILDLPIGLRATDAFVDALRKTAGTSVPESLITERGRVVDVITDMHQYFYRKKAALVGDPDHLVSLTQFLTDMDMEVLYVVTGTPAGPKFERRIKDSQGRRTGCARARGRYVPFHQLVKKRQARPHLRKHLREIYRQGRGHPAHTHRLPHL